MDATTVLVRYLHEFRSGWSLAGSVESPTSQIDFVDEQTAQVSQYIPDVAAFGQYTFNGNSYVRLAGILRWHPYRDLLKSRNHNVTGWGLQLSGRFQPDDRFTIYGCFNGGCGYQSLGGDWLMGKYDLIPEPDTPGRLYAPGALGGYVGLQFNLNPTMFFTAVYGGTRYLPKHHGYDDEYKTGQYMAVNYFWYLTPRISCAAEFNLGRRANMDGRHAWARRAGLLAQFSF